MIDEIYRIVNETTMYRDIPDEAKALAREHGYIVIVAGSDDLMYCYGADCYMTRRIEHGGVYHGLDLSEHPDEKLRREASQLGLKVFWCGKLRTKDGGEEAIEGYSVKKYGGFSYIVGSDVESRNFSVLDDATSGGAPEVYCTGIIVKLPGNFTPLI